MNTPITLDDIWALFRETDRGIKETGQLLKELTQETDRRFQETDRRFQETDRRFQETDRRFQETDRKMRETSEEVEKTSRLVKELGEQIGGLGNKFGSFTEGLALPSMQKILRKRFGVDTIFPSVRLTREGQHLEIDVLAYANGAVNAAYLVEVKSHLRERDIDQLLKLLRRFPDWFPEHRGKALYGILAAVDIPPHLEPLVLAQGIYLAQIHEEMFDLRVPEGFQARRFDVPEAPGPDG